MLETPPVLLNRVDIDLYISQQIQQTEALASIAKSFEVIAKSLQRLAYIVETNSYGQTALNIREINPP
ncbi:hypothetical protein [Candidatus Bathycorpusculum sp.]|uniref:hypothetical protein n=1 Tax=Candidatus Bathycorpusculum sp. TaxID=2994959 RepID=UPI00283328B5|nr:hypothetical protein [Candidatus Termitimicrobium sp.]MCL2685934.1 hypothetical protein [Candidatus Termitimicrobium sp.]